MDPAPLRCHLLIGAPGSGKSTVAERLAALLQGAGGEQAQVLSTDAIRTELYGDASIQGPWAEIRGVLLERLHDAVASGIPVILDATHARRPWRLLYTQVLQLPRPVEWIGWWLTTPLAICLEWTQRREHPVPEAVIQEFHACLQHSYFKPGRNEGFATIVTLNPAAGEAESTAIEAQLRQLDRRIAPARNRNQARESHLHRYARLLDLERLLFLLRLLTRYNGLDCSDPGTAAELAQICNPPPVGDLAEQAAAYLSAWGEVHGGSGECYGDADAIRADLAWLEANGFIGLDWSSDQPIELGPDRSTPGSTVHGGYPSLADPIIFRRVFTLLRHILKEPFDAPEADGKPPSPRPKTERQKRSKRGDNDFGPLYRHLIARLSPIEGSYRDDQEAVLRHDLQQLLRPYGFLPQVQGRPHSLRHGYAIGTALLSADQLLEIHALLKASMDRLSDRSQKPLLEALEDRLQRAGLLQQHQGRSAHYGRRALANRSFTEEKTGTLAAADQSQRVERAIRDRRRLWLRHLPDRPTNEQLQRGDDGRFRAWPLQLLFHNISWYLAFECCAIGHEHGLIRALRVDRLVVVEEDGNARRNCEAEHIEAMERLQRLMEVCGGVYFGQSTDDQLALMPAPHENVSGRANSRANCLELLRFSCTQKVFAVLREAPRRFPLEHTAYSKAIPGLSSWEEGPLDRLEPNDPQDSHPYPVEILLPHWTIHEDWDLRNWLFRWGAEVRIESPPELRALHGKMATDVVSLYLA